MKKLLIILGAASALILAGCNQGGTSDQYGTSSGTANSSNSIHSSGVSSNNAATP
jgi:protein involved in sex pheromone biosynthesis